MSLSAITKPFKNPYYRIGSSFSFNFFLGWALFWALYSVWLSSEVGLTGGQIGLVYTLNQASSLLFMFLFGIIQDKLGLRKYLLFIVTGCITLTGPFFVYFYEPLLQTNFYLAAIVGSIFLGVGYLAGSGLVDSYIEKMSRGFNFEFGQSRFFGSFGYSVGALITGILFAINPHYSFWLVSAVGIVFTIILISFDQNKQENYVIAKNDVTKADFIALFKNKQFLLFIVFIVGTNSFYHIADNMLFSQFYVSLFDTVEEGTKVYGYLNSFQVLLEACMMAVIPLLINRIGAKPALLLGASIMLTRELAAGLSTDVYFISFIKLMHAIEVPLAVLATFKFAVANFDKRLSATVFLIGFSISTSIGVIIFSTPLGMLLDTSGFQPVFLIISGIIFLSIVFGMFALSNKR